MIILREVRNSFLACTLDTNYITKNAMIDNTKTPLTF